MGNGLSQLLPKFSLFPLDLYVITGQYYDMLSCSLSPSPLSGFMLRDRSSGDLFSWLVKNHTQWSRRLEVVLHESPVLGSEIAECSLLQQILVECLLGVRYIARYFGIQWPGRQMTPSALKELLKHMV